MERCTHDYLRHGTVSLFAALHTGTGKVIGRCHQRRRGVEFRKFLDTIEAEVPADLDVHLIVDNYATHQTALTGIRWPSGPASVLLDADAGFTLASV